VTREIEKTPAVQIVPKPEEAKDKEAAEDYTTEKELKELLVGHALPKDHVTYLEMCIGLSVDDFFQTFFADNA